MQNASLGFYITVMTLLPVKEGVITWQIWKICIRHCRLLPWGRELFHRDTLNPLTWWGLKPSLLFISDLQRNFWDLVGERVIANTWPEPDQRLWDCDLSESSNIRLSPNWLQEWTSPDKMRSTGPCDCNVGLCAWVHSEREREGVMENITSATVLTWLLFWTVFDGAISMVLLQTSMETASVENIF